MVSQPFINLLVLPICQSIFLSISLLIKVKVQWTKQLAETQQQKTEAIKKETEKLKALADAERTKAVLEINIQQQILEREGNQNISRIENQIR